MLHEKLLLHIPTLWVVVAQHPLLSNKQVLGTLAYKLRISFYIIADWFLEKNNELQPPYMKLTIGFSNASHGWKTIKNCNGKSFKKA